MAESIVSDWLADYAALEPTEIRTFAAQHEHNHEISSALFTIINERLKYPDVLHSICDQLFSYYRSNEPELKRFTLQFVPTLIYTYLNAVAQGDKKSCRSVETLLLGMYNIEVSTDDGQPKVVSFRMPVLAQPSIYHEEKTLNAYDLRRWEENSNKDVNWGPLPQVESVNAQNRLKIMTAVMFVYNQQLSSITKSAMYHMCRVASQLVNQGFTKIGHQHRASYGSDPNTSGMVTSKPIPRIPVSTQFLLELLHASYFAMFNEFASIAIQAVDDIHNRACYELYPEVILVTNAIKNSLLANPSGQPSDGPMGISVALTPTTHTVTVSKSMITNASFRTKKLPDDIPIQAHEESGNSSNQLVSITEESEAIGGSSEPQLGMRNNLVRSSKEILKTHKVPFPGFKKLKDKDKEKDKDKDKDGSGGAAGALLVSSNTISGTTTTAPVGAKIQSSKNGNIFSDGVKESVIIAATKQLTKKDKKNSSAGLQTVSIDAGDSVYLDKASPSLQFKRKSSSVDITSNGPVTSIDLVQMPSYANGNSIISEEKTTKAPGLVVSVGNGSGDYTSIIDGNGSIEKNSDLSSIIVDHNSSKTTANNNMQISQV